MTRRSLPFLPSPVLISLPLASAFNREACLQTVQAALSNQSLSPTSPYFYRDTPSSPPYNGPTTTTVTRLGCGVFCGLQQTWYPDTAPRLTVWLFPVLLLLANVELSPLDKRHFFALVHWLGDPIDSIWSLLHKLDAWDRCYALTEKECPDRCSRCKRLVATVLAGIEEVLGFRNESEDELETLLPKNCDILREKIVHWRRAAVRLADARTDELSRTALAFLLYVFQLVTAFVPAIGGVPSSPPGGRIATSVLLSWLVPAIFLSNAVGNLASCRTACDVVTDFAAKTGGGGMIDVLQQQQQSEFFPTIPLLAKRSETDYFHALGWSGAIYTYRPWKLRCLDSSRKHHRRRELLIGLLAAAPVLLGFLGGFLILWYQLPTGLNCRHLWLVGVTMMWLMSTLITCITHDGFFATGVYHWRLTLIKDAVVAALSLLVMFLSGAGLFNFCWCWSGPFQYLGTGRVPLTVTLYLENDKSFYPMIVGVTLLLEILVSAVAVVVWRRGFLLLRWSDESRREEWKRVRSSEGCKCFFREKSPHLGQISKTLLQNSEGACSP